MSRWPASSMTEILLAFLVAALLFGAVIEIVKLLGRTTTRAIARRRARSALAGDWWARFEDEFRLFAGGLSNGSGAPERREERGRGQGGQSG